MGSVKWVMELACLQMNASSFQIKYRSSGCFQFTVRILFPAILINYKSTYLLVGVLVPLLVVIVKLGVHLPTILRGFIFYVQISPIAVEFLPQSFRLRSDVVR